MELVKHYETIGGVIMAICSYDLEKIELIQINIRIEKGIKDMIDATAKKNYMSITNLIKYYIKTGLEKAGMEKDLQKIGKTRMSYRKRLNETLNRR